MITEIYVVGLVLVSYSFGILTCCYLFYLIEKGRKYYGRYKNNG